MADLAPVLDGLVQLQNPAGGWGYGPGRYAHPEPTSLALLALNHDSSHYGPAIAAGLKSLETHRGPDGSYRLEQGRPQACWPTALAVIARRILGSADAELKPSLDVLIGVQGKSVASDPESAEILDIDTAMIGWPWAMNTFSWVEPTSWAILALRLTGQGNHPRVAEGIRTLFDRAFETGGANYGNRTVLGQITDPMPGPTAALLLALQGFDDERRVQAAKAYLFEKLKDSTDLEHLAWAVIALDCYADSAASAAALREKLAEVYSAQIADNRPIGVPRRAATALALATEQRNDFRLSDARRTPPDLTAPKPVPADYPVPGVPKPGLFGKVKSKLQNVMMTGLGAMRPLPESSAVHIATADNYDIDLLPVLQAQFEHFRKLVPLAGKKVVLKPNMVEYHAGRPINTDPRFIEAVIKLCRAEGASEVTVAEGPGHWRNTEYLLEASGLGEVLRRQQVPFVDINVDEPVKVPNLGRCTGLEYLFLPRTITTADVLISLPKLKMHHWAGVTLSLKNLFGILPGQCYGWPKNELHWRGIHNSVVDIALTQTTQLAIVDGIWGMEGDGPIYGTGRHMGALVMGHDLLAVDASCARLIGMPPERVPVLKLAEMKKLGRLMEKDIPQLGAAIAEFRAEWQWPPRVDKILLPAQ